MYLYGLSFGLCKEKETFMLNHGLVPKRARLYSYHLQIATVSQSAYVKPCCSTEDHRLWHTPTAKLGSSLESTKNRKGGTETAGHTQT